MSIEPKQIRNMSMDAIAKRAKDMFDQCEQFIKSGEVKNLHVKLQQGNSKTGKSCWTVSLIPIIDCANCSMCKDTCYDIRNVCFQPKVKTDRARNSAIHKTDIKRFWDEVSYGIKYKRIKRSII